MAYCPKCGVEVEHDVKNCPLCDFPIPDINEENYLQDPKYPQAINTYDEDHLGKKNKAFFSLTIIAISIMVIIVIIWSTPGIMFCSNTLLWPSQHFCDRFFAMGYLHPNFNFLGAYITVVITCLSVYLISGSQANWFLSYALPITTLIYLDISLLFRFVLKHTRHKSQFIFIPTNLIFL